mmetsp:Transcript_9007/g.26771  ORF Transcript_9007/g.26771 Transcript_9007/m.26771 type:complete len:113 (-) Transcript_9007:1188-1526(-)
MEWVFRYNQTLTATFIQVPMHKRLNWGRIWVVITKHVVQLFSTNPAPNMGICKTAKMVDRSKTSAQLQANVTSAMVKMYFILSFDKDGTAYNITNRTLHQRGIAIPKKNHMT